MAPADLLLYSVQLFDLPIGLQVMCSGVNFPIFFTLVPVDEKINKNYTVGLYMFHSMIFFCFKWLKIWFIGIIDVRK